MQRSPRGGGRDRDRIVRHTLFTEQDWANGLGVHPSEEAQEAMLTDEGSDALNAYRGAFPGQVGLQLAAAVPDRHTAFHTLDHAGETEDKDLTAR